MGIRISLLILKIQARAMSATFILKSSQNAGCIRLSPVSHCCHGLRFVCTANAHQSWASVMPSLSVVCTAWRAASTSSDVGLIGATGFMSTIFVIPESQPMLYTLALCIASAARNSRTLGITYLSRTRSTTQQVPLCRSSHCRHCLLCISSMSLNL